MNSDSSKKKSETKKKSDEKKGSVDQKPKTADSSTDTPKDSGAQTKNKSAPARPTSYFSSVSTDEYREGWSTIFGEQKKHSNIAKSKTLPTNKRLSIVLTNADLNDELKNLLTISIRSKAKISKQKIGRTLSKSNASWRITCEILE